MNKQELAMQMYVGGSKYKDIAEEIDVPVNTIKSWRQRNGWSRGAPKNMHPKSKRDASITQKVAPKIVDELEANNELTDKQKLFCLFYLQRFNATWAYQKAYKCNYATANVEGSKALVKPSIKKQLSNLKKQQTTDLYFNVQDIINEIRQQSKSDVRDVIEFKTVKKYKWSKIYIKSGNYEDNNGKYKMVPKIDPATGEQEYYFENIVNLHDSNEIDTANIKSIRIDKGEAVVEMYDKQKALDSLMKYADTYVNDQDDTSGVQILDNIEGDEDDGSTGNAKE